MKDKIVARVTRQIFNYTLTNAIYQQLVQTPFIVTLPVLHDFSSVKRAFAGKALRIRIVKKRKLTFKLLVAMTRRIGAKNMCKSMQKHYVMVASNISSRRIFTVAGRQRTQTVAVRWRRVRTTTLLLSPTVCPLNRVCTAGRKWRGWSSG